MPVDPMIARPYVAQFGDTLREAMRTKVADDYRNALMQQRNNELAFEREQAAATAAQEDEEERLWDEAYARKDWGALARIDPQTTRVLMEYEREQKPAPAPGPITLERQPDGATFYTQDGKVVGQRMPQAAPQYAPESFSEYTDAEGKVHLIGSRGTIRPTALRGKTAGTTGAGGVTIGPNGELLVDPGKSSEGERVSAGYLGRMRNTDAVIRGSTYRPTATAFSAFTAMLSEDTGLIGTNIANMALNDSDRAYMGAALDFILAKLRKESGATIRPGEFRLEYTNLFPMPGDSAGVLKAKERKRELALRQIEISAGRSAPSAEPARPPAAPPAALEYLKSHPETAEAFRRKYGYLPNE